MLTAYRNCSLLVMAALALGSSSTMAADCPLSKTPAAMHVATDVPNIVETAVAAEGFQTLVAAVKAAGLVETLSGEGPFTVFAPTDEAFAKLPKGTLETLLKPENKDQLVAILTYHVVPGAVYAKDAVKLDKAKTVQGSELTLKVVDDALTIDGAKVVQADLECSNGVIHVIDAVVLPKAKSTN